MKVRRLFGLLMLVLCLGLFTGCTCGDDDDDDDDNDDDNDTTDDDNDTSDDDDDTIGDDDDDDDDDDDTAIVDIDFEDYDLGPLGAPWDVTILGGSTATIVEDPTRTTGSGRMLEINGSTTFNESVEAALGFAELADDFTLSLDFYYEPGATFVFSMTNSTQVESPFNLMLHDNELRANTSGSPDPCATLTADQWTTLGLLVRPSLAKYTVSLDGVPIAACTDLDFDMGFAASIAALYLLDVGNDGGGGVIYFDNLLVDWAK